MLKAKLDSLQQFHYYLTESSSTGIIGINTDEKIVVFNQSAEEMFGVSIEEILYQPFSVLQKLMGSKESLLLNTLHEGLNYEVVEAIIESPLGPINVLAYTDLVRNNHGEVIGAYLGLRDITAQKQLENQVFQNEKFFAVRELAAGMAHEVRNPLTSIRGFLQLFNTKLLIDDPNKKITELMLKEIERADGIIKQFLLLSNPVLPIRKETDIHKLIKETVTLVGGETLTKGVKVEIHRDNSMPLIKVDPEQILQVLLNIAENALSALEKGGRLLIETMYEAENKRAHIIISDTGPGMDSHTLERIFDPFFTTRAEGTGLGLTVSNKIIQNHGGKIEAQSKEGSGSSFRIILPFIVRD